MCFVRQYLSNSPDVYWVPWSEWKMTPLGGCRFSIAELLHDSEEAKQAEAAAREAEKRRRKEEKSARRKSRRWGAGG